MLVTRFAVILACSALAANCRSTADTPAEQGPGGAPGAGRAEPRSIERGSPAPADAERAAALSDALAWLARHQSPEGHWDADAFTTRCPEHGATCDRPGEPLNDVGLTSLALLAFLGAGQSPHHGPQRETVREGVRWLRDAQNAETGLIGERTGHGFLYNHGIATLALCETYRFTGSPRLKDAAQAALTYVSRARNPYGAWRYDVPPVGDNDTSVTGWMVLALTAGEAAELEVDEEAFAGALAWIEEVTDVESGRVGYDALGSRSSRVMGANDHFPTERSEAMTAVGLLCRILLGQTPDSHPILEQHARLLLKTLPEWDPDGLGCDMYYWFFGTHAMYQMGGSYWEAWDLALARSVVSAQRGDGDSKGSWDPIGPWGYAGGRVFSTALLALALEAPYRYERLLPE